MGWGQGLHGFVFDQHRALNQHVGREVADHHPVALDRDRMLVRDIEAGLAQLMRQRISIDGLQKARPQEAMYAHGAADDPFGQLLVFHVVGQDEQE